MKKIILLLGSCLLAVEMLMAAPILDDYAPTQWPNEPIFKPVGSKYVLRPILEGKPLVVSLWIEQEKEGSRDLFSRLIVDGYNAWFRYATQEIKAKGRAAEFQDILRYIDRQIPITVVSSGDADIKVRMWNDTTSLDKFCGGAIACHHDDYLEFNNTLNWAKHPSVFIHEIGHTLGMNDWYHAGTRAASYLYSSSTTHKGREGMMGSNNIFSCTDVDELINLIDLTLSLTRPNGGSWKSFCAGSKETFQNGISNVIRYSFANRNKQWLVQEYEDSKKISETIFSYAGQIIDPFWKPQLKEILKRDGAKRPALWEGPQGEKIYKVYGKERDHEEHLIVKNNQVLVYQETFVRNDKKEESERVHLRKYFALGDRKGRLSCSYGPGVRTAEYDEFKYGESKPYFELYLSIKDGKIEDMHSEGDRSSSVLFEQFMEASMDPSIGMNFEKFKNQQIKWQEKFVDWAEHWPRYLGFLPEE